MNRHAGPPGAPDVPAVPEPTFAERARTLVDQARSGSLATVSRKHSGHPFASVMPYALDAEGRPLVLISSMAVHTQNLHGDARASLLVTQPGGASDPLAAGRVTLMGEASRAGDRDHGAHESRPRRRARRVRALLRRGRGRRSVDDRRGSARLQAAPAPGRPALEHAHRVSARGEDGGRQPRRAHRDAQAGPRPVLIRAARIASHTRCGVSGMSRSSTPSGASASRTALTKAAGAPIVPDSPQPFAPSGLWVQGWLSSTSVANDGSASARGSA